MTPGGVIFPFQPRPAQGTLGDGRVVGAAATSERSTGPQRHLLTVIAALLALNLLPRQRVLAEIGATGACCLLSSECIDGITVDECTDMSGASFHPNETCLDVVCPPIGACCFLPEGVCVDGESAQYCYDLAGVFQGSTTTCETPAVVCEPQGACCVPATGTCAFTSEADCLVAEGEWLGFGTDCSDTDFNGLPDVCETTCPADLDGDGTVGNQRLPRSTRSVGAVPVTVGILDLLILLGNWTV